MTWPIKLAISLVLILLLFPALWLINYVVQKHGKQHRISAHRIATMSKLLRGGTIFLALGILGGIWQVNISAIAIYLGSVRRPGRRPVDRAGYRGSARSL